MKKGKMIKNKKFLLMIFLLFGVLLTVLFSRGVSAGWEVNLSVNGSLYFPSGYGEDVPALSGLQVFNLSETEWYAVFTGNPNGQLYSYSWNGTDWAPNSTINSSILIGEWENTKPNVFYMPEFDTSYLLMPWTGTGIVLSYAWNGTSWISAVNGYGENPYSMNSSIIPGYELMTTYYVWRANIDEGEWKYYLLNLGEGCTSYVWNNTEGYWNLFDSEEGEINICSGLQAASWGSVSISTFYKNFKWYALISSYADDGGNVRGFVWNGTTWKPDFTVNSSLSVAVPEQGEVFPNVFYKGSSWHALFRNEIGNFFGYTYVEDPDTTSPTYSSHAINNTSGGEITKFSILIDDNYLLNSNGSYTFSTNNTGIWTNDTPINFTTTPNWANVTKTLNSTPGTFIGYLWYFNDSMGNVNSTEVYTLTIPGFPTFTTIPNNVSLFYGNESLSSVFLGADNVNFGYYSINDTTKFSITSFSNGTGVLKNATPLGVGNYEINVTINNSLGNINWTTYKIQINKSLKYDCGIYFNTTSPVTYPENFIVYTNCSSGYTIYRNGSAVSNNSVINSGAGYYNLSVQRTDTSNYTNTFNEQSFTVNKNTEDCKVLFDTTSPVTYGTSFKVYANCSTDFILYKDGTEIENNSEQSLSAGTYNFSFQRTDSSNYSIYYNETVFTVTEAAATINSNVGGGSGGGSNPNAPKTYTADETVISSTQGETFELKPLDKVSFEIRESTHTATLNSYTSTTARITIRSTPFSVLLEKGILTELDLNNDLINDLAIRYDGLINGKVSLFMKEILPVAEEVPETDENTIPEEDAPLETPTTPEKDKLKLSTWIIIIVSALIIVLIVGYLCFTLIKNHKRKSRYY